ncbi:barstar family protein [Marinobacter zhejiangensis]|uniref:Barstar, RNAse (Barnase) inhibitor n=1 Tax=Marinobacter zhejiangensis TaxID=488535 RepID=A0A1I4QC93_9GAMM|nr:barstar family protein [Marinobacter zhejiangensis]SFM37243.1 Barstar, RNAse (barnase) inhibitor [Marinobacter zhejiangensis]
MQINIESIRTEKVLHEALANSLGFPDFYGKNWAAFWDSITALVDMPRELEFVGTAHLRAVLPEAYQQLRHCLEELNQQYPDLRCHVEWN